MSNEILPTTIADIVVAYVSNNEIAAEDLPSLVSAVHAALASLNAAPEDAPSQDKPTPAISAKQSLADPNVIKSMIDGRPYVTLKRHLEKHGYTPDSYRAAFGLKSDYPMVAPRYSEMRSDVARRIGFGRKKKDEAPAAETQSSTGRKRLKPAFDR